MDALPEKFYYVPLPHIPRPHMPELPRLRKPDLPRLRAGSIPRLRVSALPRLRTPELPRLRIPDVSPVARRSTAALSTGRRLTDGGISRAQVAARWCGAHSREQIVWTLVTVAAIVLGVLAARL